jgi:ribosomal protein S18 acetylase RimI-like enzyme
MGWLYPILRAGIYEDLKTRLQNRTRHYACLVAVKPGLRQSPELVSNPGLTRLAGKGDVLMGTVELSLKTPPMIQPWRDKYLYLSNLAVKTEYRHRGVAQELLKTCERIALDWGFEDLYLHVLENNDAAQRLYWRAGYRMQRTEISPFSLLLGQPRQLFLHKRLRRE